MSTEEAAEQQVDNSTPGYTRLMILSHSGNKSAM